MFRHYFISARNGKAVEVSNHMLFVTNCTSGNPDADTERKMKTLGVTDTKPIKNLTCASASKFLKPNELIRLSWFNNEVGIDSYVNPQKVFDIVKHFGEQYGFKYGYELTFTNNNNDKYFTILWEYFVPAVEDDKTSLIMRFSSMDIKQELIKIAGMIAPTVQQELKKHEDSIFEDLEKNVLSNDRLLKNFKAWVYRDDDFKTPYLDDLKGSATVSRVIIERILSKYSSAFGKLNSKEKKAETDAFFKSFKTLPIEDITIESDGDFDKDIKYAQASWVLNDAGLSVKIDMKRLKNIVEGLDT